MNITIIGRKCTPRDSFKERVNKKLSKIDRFFDKEADAKVTAAVEKSYQSVEITVTSGGMVFRAQESADNLNDALDKCIETLVRRIRKHKTKLEKRLRTGAFESFDEDGSGDESGGEDENDEQEETEFELVRRKTVSIKPQSVDEAILQMNMLGHEFYMFINSDNEEVSVVYKRKGGGYGLLEPYEE